MHIFVPHDYSLHAPEWYLADGSVRPCPETPARVDAILQSLAGSSHNIETVAGPADDAELLTAIRTVHAPDYLHYLQTIHPIWTAEFASTGGRDVMPDTFPRRMPGTRPPKKPSAQAGYYCFDTAAPIMAGTWRAAIASAHCAISAARAVLATHTPAYALCRPPGHHAGPDYCGGFCFLNNVAIAAQFLLNRGCSRVAVLDVDYHHGNGTQDIFYRRCDVLFVSLHAEPDTQYPYFWGFAEETGEGQGMGFNMNLPLKRGCSAAEWFAALDTALARITAFDPQAVIVSLGVDTFEKDDVGDFQLSLDDFARLGAALSKPAPVPMLLIQEGGYRLQAIGPCVAAVLGALHRGAPMPRASSFSE